MADDSDWQIVRAVLGYGSFITAVWLGVLNYTLNQEKKDLKKSLHEERERNTDRRAAEQAAREDLQLLRDTVTPLLNRLDTVIEDRQERGEWVDNNDFRDALRALDNATREQVERALAKSVLLRNQSRSALNKKIKVPSAEEKSALGRQANQQLILGKDQLREAKRLIEERLEIE